MLRAVVKFFASPAHRLQKPLHPQRFALQAGGYILGRSVRAVLVCIHMRRDELHPVLCVIRVPDGDATQFARYAFGCVCCYL
jgi:hypothetical protein